MDFSESTKGELGYFPQVCVCDERLTAELNSDFSLPDYQPEIRRLISSSAYLSRTDEYIGGSSAELSGDVIYKIFYLGADGQLYSVSLTDKYSLSAPISFRSECVNTDSVTLLPTISISGCTVKVNGPRKLNIRSRADCRAIALSPALCSPTSVGAHDIDAVEDLVLDTESILTDKCSSETFVLTDFITLDSSSESIRMIDCSMSSAVGECIASDGKISVRGEIGVKLLYCNDTESDDPLLITRKIPFTCTVPCKSAESGMECLAYCDVEEDETNVDENGISIRLSATVNAVVQANAPVSYIADAYSTERTSECRTGDFSVLRAVKCSVGALTCNEVFSLDDIRLSPDAKLIDVIARYTPDDASVENGKLLLRGTGYYQIIYTDNGEYASRELSAPFKYSVDCHFRQSADGRLKWSAYANCTSARARSDGERLFIDAELNIGISAYEESELRTLSEITFGEVTKKARGEIVLCYPAPDEDLWSIAKRYGVRRADIMQKNSLSDEASGASKKFLII